MTEKPCQTTPPKQTIRELHDAQLAKALSHPIRLRILALLEDGNKWSVKDMANALDVGLEGFSYHVRSLRDAGFLEKAGRKIVRGAVQHYYRIAAQRPRISDELWAALPGPVRTSIADATLGRYMEDLTAALASGGFETAETILVRQPMVLDEEAFKIVAGMLQDLFDQLEPVEEAARERIGRGKSKVYPGTVLAAFYNTPPHDAPVADHELPGRKGAAARRAREQQRATS